MSEEEYIDYLKDNKCLKITETTTQNHNHSIYATKFYSMQKQIDDRDKEIERLKRQIKIKDEWCDRIWEVGTDYDGYGNNLEELRKLVDELIEYSNKAKKCDDKSVAYISYENGKDIEKNILMEELGSDKE